jgi:hypothetical protein
MATKIVKKHRHLEAAKPLGENDGQADAEPVETTKLSYVDAEDLEQILKRILKLSNQADNPGVAYRNLETIHALAETLVKKLGLEMEPLPYQPEHTTPSSKLKN